MKKYESLKMLLRCNLKINCKAAGDPKTFRKLLNSFSFVCCFFLNELNGIYLKTSDYINNKMSSFIYFLLNFLNS